MNIMNNSTNGLDHFNGDAAEHVHASKTDKVKALPNSVCLYVEQLQLCQCCRTGTINPKSILIFVGHFLC